MKASLGFGNQEFKAAKVKQELAQNTVDKEDRTMFLDPILEVGPYTNKESSDGTKTPVEILFERDSKRSSDFSNSVINKTPINKNQISLVGSIAKDRSKFYGVSLKRYTCEIVSHFQGKQQDKETFLSNHYCYTATEAPDYEESPNHRKKPRNLTFCLTGHGKNPKPTIDLLRNTIVKHLDKSFNTTMSPQRGLEQLKNLFDCLTLECIDGQCDMLYSGVSISIGFVLGNHLIYGNIGANSLFLISKQENSCSQISKQERFTHTWENQAERQRVLNLHDRINYQGDIAHIAPVTRCLGLMHLFKYGVKEKGGIL